MLPRLFTHWKSFLIFLFASAVIWFGGGEVARAQEGEILDRLYGNGVHAYKRGDYVTAHRWLSEAINTGNRDPRTRYFRGLSYLKLGRPEQADGDFFQAAKGEIANGNITKLVDQSLVTVQGPDRYRLESARTNAQRERHQRNQGMLRERNAPPEQIRPGTPRDAEPAEGTMKDLPTPDKEAALLETDDRSSAAEKKGDVELFQTDDTQKAKTDDLEETNLFGEDESDDFPLEFDNETEEKPADSDETDDSIFD